MRVACTCVSDHASIGAEARCSLEEEILTGLETDSGRIAEALDTLHADIRTAEKIEDAQESAEYYERTVLKDMAQLRASVDHAEERIPDSYLPYPTYSQILFSTI